MTVRARRNAWLIGAAVALAATGASAQTRTGGDRAARDLSDAVDAYGAKDCVRALALAEPWLTPNAATKAPREPLMLGYSVAAQCRVNAGNLDIAYRHVLAATGFAEASDWHWHTRFGLEYNADRWDAVVVTIEAMAKDRRAALNALEPGWLYTANRALKRSGKIALHRRLVTALVTSGYTPPHPILTADPFRQDYAEFQLADGDTAGATATLRGITQRRVLIELSVDPRFRTMLGPDFNVRAATERNLATSRAAIAAYPDLLAPVIEVANILRTLGRFEESLAVLEGARARVEGRGKPYADAADNVSWWWNALARGHVGLGQFDQAFAAYRAGISAGEDDAPNVSQVINLAHAQNRAGRPRDALETLKPFDTGLAASPFGLAEMRQARGCANALLGNGAVAAQDLAWLRQHVKDNRGALTRLLLCMDDLDGAAAAMIAQLDDPQERARALVLLSDYDAPPVALPPDPVDSKLALLKARPDVQAAIARAGGIRRFNIQGDEL